MDHDEFVEVPAKLPQCIDLPTTFVQTSHSLDRRQVMGILLPAGVSKKSWQGFIFSTFEWSSSSSFGILEYRTMH
jgi:hypothetical protein